jgi:hypothetical protein
LSNYDSHFSSNDPGFVHDTALTEIQVANILLPEKEDDFAIGKW